MSTLAAVDLGATSGRIVRATMSYDCLNCETVHRFATPTHFSNGHLRWSWREIMAEIKRGLALAGPLDSIGIDSWGVDYGLIGADGQLLDNPVHYRDRRGEAALGRLDAIDRDELYRDTGIDLAAINTAVQLTADPMAETAELILPIADLAIYCLTGSSGTDPSLASTTGLYSPSRHAWSPTALAAHCLPQLRLPELTPAGTIAGSWNGIPVVRVAGHDTASALTALPPTANYFISAGTWSLAGVLTPTPVLTPAARGAGFSNEQVLGGSISLLRNLTGLYLLERVRTQWDLTTAEALDLLIDEAERVAPLASWFDTTDPAIAAAADCAGEIVRACAANGPAPTTPGAIVRAICDSLALTQARTIRTAASLTGIPVEQVYLVGGGSRNRLLAQATADALGVLVIAGPAEATAVGNIGVQLETHELVQELTIPDCDIYEPHDDRYQELTEEYP